MAFGESSLLQPNQLLALVFGILGTSLFLFFFGSSSPLFKRARHRSTPFQRLTAFHDAHWGIPLEPTLTTLPTHMDLDDPSSDILPGEPFLTNALGITILVRVEYLQVFNMVKKVYNESHHTHLAVVTGQPGIGKTLWIHYALRRCLGQKQPVIWCLNKVFYLFSHTGVEIYDPENSSCAPYTWCFVDSADSDPLPTTVYHPLYSLFPIYVTSLKEERWEKLYKCRQPSLVIMDPWTRAELEKAAKRLYPHRELNDIFERFDNAGPSACQCLELSPAEIQEFYDEREKVITLDTTEGMLAVLLDGEGGLHIGDISHTLCVVRRSDSESCEYIVGPISSFIRHRLLTQLWEWKEQDRVDMIEHFSHVPGAGGMRGLIFESLHQRRFAANIQIEARPMFRSNNTRSRWHATFGDFSANPALGKAQEDALNGGPPPICLSIVPSGSRAYNHSEPNIEIEENVYYVPLAANEVAIDSFIVHAKHLYMFQFTSGIQHGVNHSLLATLKRFSNLPPPANWHYIFVVPEDSTTFTGSCPCDVNGFLADHVPYVVQVGNSMW